MTKQEVIDTLRQLDIPFWTEGKNVSQNSVNINCPFCPDMGVGSDPSNHCGIFYGDETFSCWRCGKSGPLVYLLQTLTGFERGYLEDLLQSQIVYDNAVDKIEDYFNEQKESPTKKEKRKVSLPIEFEKITTSLDFPLFYKYLERRKLNMATPIKYSCGVCRSGKYMNRMVVPIFFNNEIVSFQALDLTGKANLKCATASNDINDFLGNYNNIKKRMILTEGILDWWRVREDVVCTFGTHITDKQKQLIIDKKLDILIFAWDGDAYWKAKKEADFFYPFIDRVEVIKLPFEHDPDSFGKENFWKIVNEIV